MGDEVYEDRYMLRLRHLVLVVVFSCLIPLVIAWVMLNSYDDSIDEDFKEEVLLKKIWLGNGCDIDLNDASEIL